MLRWAVALATRAISRMTGSLVESPREFAPSREYQHEFPFCGGRWRARRPAVPQSDGQSTVDLG